MSRSSAFRSAAVVFIVVYLLHAAMPVSLQGDSRWTIPTALHLLHQHSPDLTDDAGALVANDFYLIECVGPGRARQYPIHSLDQCAGARIYAYNPIAVPLLATPFVALLEASLPLPRPVLTILERRAKSPVLQSFFRGDLAGSTPIVELLISSFFTAASVTLIYLAALEFLPLSPALMLAFTFGFGTLLWSLVSRALWQHSPSIFVNSLLVLLLVRGKFGRRTCVVIGFLLALGFFIRPTNAVPVLVIGGYLVTRIRKDAIWLAPGALIPTACFAAINLQMYGRVLAPFFLPVRANSTSLAFHSELGTALLGNLISPARGLFVFMPFFLVLLLPSVWRHPMPGCVRRVRPWFCALVGMHMFLVAMHTDWWGGFSYGPRYLSDVLPYLMVLWSPALLWMQVHLWRKAAVIVLLAVAVLIPFRGATSVRVHQWNSSPVDVNRDTSRIWDWSDPPFLR